MIDTPPEKSTARELVEKTVEAGAGLIPFVGSPVAVAFAVAMGWSHNKRMQLWLTQLAEAVTELQETTEGWPSLEELAQNEIFTDAVVNASRAAQATHQAEKLEALRNAVLNSIAPSAPSTDEQMRFIRLIDRFSPAHLRLLALFDDPDGMFLREGLGEPDLKIDRRPNFLQQVPDLLGMDSRWLQILIEDLVDEHLTPETYGWLMNNHDDGPHPQGSTALGARFIAFIRRPRSLSATEEPL